MVSKDVVRRENWFHDASSVISVYSYCSPQGTLTGNVRYQIGTFDGESWIQLEVRWRDLVNHSTSIKYGRSRKLLKPFLGCCFLLILYAIWIKPNRWKKRNISHERVTLRSQTHLAVSAQHQTRHQASILNQPSCSSSNARNFTLIFM